LTSSSVLGLYFSTHGCIRGTAGASAVGFEELDPFSAANRARALLSKNDAAIVNKIAGAAGQPKLISYWPADSLEKPRKEVNNGMEVD